MDNTRTVHDGASSGSSARRRWGLAVIVIVLVVGGAVALWLGVRGRAAGVSGDFPQQGYVWQRDWDASVRLAVSQRGPGFDALVVLAAEVSWDHGRPSVTYIDLDDRTLRHTGRPIGLSVRMGAFRGRLSADGPGGAVLREVGAAVLRRAAKAGLRVAELQIDFDAATSQLAGYRRWIVALRRAVDPTPVTITALPSWMRSADFGALVRATDGYVLQVHSLERPSSIRTPVVLCDPARAEAWVRQAAGFGVPFRPALPTYSYDLAFDGGGAFIGLSADGLRPAWPEGTRVRRLEADPAAMASVIRHWRRRRPAEMVGVIWYRLPVDGERLNWPWATLRVVMRGGVPEPRLKVRLTHRGSGLLDVSLVNDGSAPAPLGQVVVVRWNADADPMADAVAGFQLNRLDRRSMEYRPAPEARRSRLRPGDTRAVGWLRFNDSTGTNMEVHADVQPLAER